MPLTPCECAKSTGSELNAAATLEVEMQLLISTALVCEAQRSMTRLRRSSASRTDSASAAIVLPDKTAQPLQRIASPPSE